MKKILILNGGYSEIPLIKAAKKLGFYTIVTGNNNKLPGNELGDEYIACDYSDKEAICELAKSKGVNAICSSCNDFAYLSAAYACEKLGLPGHDSYEIALTLHHKDRYRALARKNHLPVPKVIEYETESDIDKIEMLQFPVIIKPVDLFGGIGMKKCTSLNEVKWALHEALSKSRTSKVLIEEFLEGTNHGFTTIIQNKKVAFYMVDKEYHDYSPFAVSAASVPVDMPKAAIDSLKQQIGILAEDLQLCDGLLHTQFILTKGGKPVILEVCRRSPGDLYIEFVKYATGVNYPELILSYEGGLPVKELNEKSVDGFWARHVLACTKEGRLQKIVMKDKLLPYIKDKEIQYEIGKKVEHGEIYKNGVLFLQFSNQIEMENMMCNITECIDYVMETTTPPPQAIDTGIDLATKRTETEEMKELFQDRKSDTYYTIKALKERHKPVYIYGIGKTADRVFKKLTENGVKVSGFFVDDEFAGEHPKGTYSFKDVMNLPEADVVIGFYQFGIAYSKIAKKEIYNKGKVFMMNPEPLFDYKYYLDNKTRFEETFHWLSDDLSKATMHAYMDGRMNGVMLPMAECYVPNQYFIPEVKLEKEEVFVDCGMYDGDTIEEFIKQCPDYKLIIGFEPDKSNIEKFDNRNIKKEQIIIINKGVWSTEGMLGFLAEGTTSSRITESSENQLPVTAIDLLEIEKPITFIKMDIEGSELEALKGAKDTIQKYMPKLAICVYHKKEDMITIPQYIKSLEPAGYRYSFFLRHHSLYEHETVLYAIPEKRG